MLVLTDKIRDRISSILLSDKPDILLLRRLIKTQLKTTQEEADYTLYQIVKHLNNRLFPAINNLELFITEECNFACKYCFESAYMEPHTHRRQKMSSETIKNAVDLLFDYSRNRQEMNVTLFGGEPTLYFRGLRETTEYIEKKSAHSGQNVTINMTSNGSKFTPEMVDYFGEHNIKVLLSIDGLQPTHDLYRVDKSGYGTFDRVMQNMQLLKRKQPWVGTKMTVMPAVVTKIYKNVVGLYKLGINQFLIGYATGVHWSQEDREVYCSQLKKVYEWYKSEERTDLRISEFDENNNGKVFFGCGAARNTISITSNGEIAGCSRIIALNNEKIIGKLGDVKYGLFNIKNRIDMVDCKILKTNCENEGIIKEYQGGCFSVNYEANNDLYQPSKLAYTFSLMVRNVCN